MMDNAGRSPYNKPAMVSRSFRAEESRARYWAQKAVELCSEIDDESLNELIVPIQNAEQALNRDRRIMVIGGQKCGKSSLLAAVAGCPLVASVPLTGDYVCWRYRAADGDSTASRFIVQEQLEGLELVDTADCAVESVAETIRRLMKGADVVIAVVDARSAEASPVWSVLASLPEERRPACLVALSYADTLSAGEEQSLKERLKEHSRTYTGTPLPLYSVSPHRGASAMETFLLRVQEALDGPNGVRSAIRHLVECGKELVRRQGSVLVAREHAARTNSGFLAGIEQEIDSFLERQRSGVSQCVESYSEAAMQALPTTLQKLRLALGWVFSPVTLLRMEGFGVGTEKFYYRTLRDEILTRQEDSDMSFVLSCMGHWQSVRPRMKKSLECEIGEFPAEELRNELEELRMRMGRSLYAPFTALKLRTAYSKVFQSNVWWMSLCCALICFLLFVAGVLGGLGLDFLALGVLALAGGVWVLGTIAHLIIAHTICREISLLSLTLQEELKRTVGEAIENLLVCRVAAYRRLYTAPREKVAYQESTLKPLQQQQKDINMQLNAAAPRL